MELDWILQLVLFGVLHWILAVIVLQDLAARKRVIGGHKAPWVLLVLLLTFVGSLIYMLFHPQILSDSDRDRR